MPEVAMPSGLSTSLRSLGKQTESYYRARYYDSANGRFLSEDPIGFNGGSDFYAYVYNDSADFSDPWGLRKYKCNWMAVCAKFPFGPKSAHPKPTPKPQPCPLIAKDFDGFNRCFDNAFPNNLPAAWGKQIGDKTFNHPIPISPNEQPSVPDFGLGDLASTAGKAAEDAILECFKEHPLAGLDPRFDPALNPGKMSSPNWWDGVTGFLGFSSPIF